MIDYKVGYKVENLIFTPKIEETRFAGAIEEKFQKVILERMTSENAQQVVFKEAEDAFLNCVDDANAPIGMWQGEFWGKLIISACRGCRYNRDEKLKEFIRGSVKKILAFQREDGYLGTYRNPEHIFAANLQEGKRIIGFECNWTWNIWCRKYILWGLLEAYELLEDEEILKCAIKATDQLIDMLDRMGAKIGETGVLFGQPSTSILKPILILYRHTGDSKYLDFALEIAKEWEDEETCCTKLIRKSLAGIPVHLWNDDTMDIPVKSTGNPFKKPGEPAFGKEEYKSPETGSKGYEMQSGFDGLLELYRITGIEKYFTATKKFFDLLIKYEYNTLFCVGFNDLFINAAKNPNSISELCDVIHFIRLGTELYKLTGKVDYLDYVELAFYNPFLAGVTRDGSWAARGVRPTEGHMYAIQQAGFVHNHCCTNNMARGFVNVAETIAMCNKENIYINLYGEANVTLHPTKEETVKIRIKEGYIGSCKAKIEIKADLIETKKLKLRIPKWSNETNVTIDGIAGKKTYVQKAASYFECELYSGGMKVYIDFDNTPRLIEDHYNLDFFPVTPYMKQRYYTGGESQVGAVHVDTMLTENKARICVGPILLAASVDLGSTKEEIFDHNTVNERNCKCSVAYKEVEGFMAAYDVKLECEDGEVIQIPMGDFASASDTMEHVDYRYTIFI